MATKLKSFAIFTVKFLLVFLIITILQKICDCKGGTFFAPTKNFKEVTGIQCEEFDQEYVKIDTCIFKTINRTHKYFHGSGIALKTWKKPCMMRFRIMKRANGGYKPFGIDATFEGCQYLAGKKNRVVEWFYNLALENSNINHSCPYVEKEIVFFKIPLSVVQYPSVFSGGDYRFDIEFGTAGKMRAAAHSFISIKELSAN